MDLFSSAAEDALLELGPLPSRLRPRTIDDIVGQDHLLAANAPLRRLIEGDRLHSMILWGPPGTGKTSIARAVCAATSAAFEQLSAVSAGVKEVRDVLERARFRLGSNGHRTVLFLDEIHRFSKSQQDALLPAVEDGTVILIGATTENPAIQVNGALLSRSVVFRLQALTTDSLKRIVLRCCEELGCTIESDAMDDVVRRSSGDARKAVSLMDLAFVMASGSVVALEDVERAGGSHSIRYGVEEHYDVTSAFIKSVRGSDPQAALFYLARMLSAGEDPRFIARRMVVSASEDIGMADPQALLVAVSAAQALDLVGLPEAQLNLAQAAVYLATAPKSDSVAQAIWAVSSAVDSAYRFEVPEHLRDPHYSGAKGAGRGTGYLNPHAEPERSASQSYLPDDFAKSRWYEPSDAGFEQEIRARMSAGTTSSSSVTKDDQARDR